MLASRRANSSTAASCRSAAGILAGAGVTHRAREILERAALARIFRLASTTLREISPHATSPIVRPIISGTERVQDNHQARVKRSEQRGIFDKITEINVSRNRSGPVPCNVLRTNLYRRSTEIRKRLAVNQASVENKNRRVQ